MQGMLEKPTLSSVLARTIIGKIDQNEINLTFYKKDEINSLDQDRIVYDLASDMAGYDPVGYFRQFSLRDYHHILLATDDNGRCLALLGMAISRVEEATCLNLVTGFAVDRAQGKGLMRRMISHSVLKLSTVGIFPKVMAARTYNPVWYRMLNRVGAALPGSAFYPQLGRGAQDAGLISLATEAVSALNPGALFEADLGVIRGVLVKTPNLFRQQRPRCGFSAVGDFFHTELGALDLVLTLLDLRQVSAASRTTWLGLTTEGEVLAA